MASATQKAIETAVVGATVQALHAVDAKLDQEITKLDNMDSKALAELRQKRLAELQARTKLMAEWKSKGHGTYSEVQDQKDWFQECKTNERVVCHFYRSTTARCEIVDKHLSLLAPKHMETRFIKIDVEKAPFLCERLSIVLLPTIYMAKDSTTLDLIEGFDELGKTDDFSTATLEKRLAKRGAIDLDPSELAEEADKAAAKGKGKAQPVKANKTGAAIYSGSGQKQKELSDSELTDGDD